MWIFNARLQKRRNVEISLILFALFDRCGPLFFHSCLNQKRATVFYIFLPFKIQMQWNLDWYSELLCNEVVVITNDFIYPSNSKIYHEKEPRYNETSIQYTYSFIAYITGYFCFKTDSTQQLTHKSVKVRIQRLKSTHNKLVNKTGYAIRARCETEKGFLFGLFLLSIYFYFAFCSHWFLKHK